MKKYLIIVLLLVVPVLTGATGRKQAVSQEKLTSIINEYKACDGFEVTKIGKVGTSAIKNLIRLSAKTESSQDVKDALDIIKGIKKLAIVEYDNCSEDVRDRFNHKISKALESSELLMEVKDGNDRMSMYGVVNGNSSEVKDFILFSPNECTLVCLFGSIPMDAISRIAAR